MAINALPNTGGWRGTGGEWTELSDSGQVASGRSGETYYRSVVAFSTAGLVISKCEKLVVKVVTDQTSSPAGCKGVLTLKSPLNELSNSGNVQNSDRTDWSETLEDGHIAWSYAYKDSEKSGYAGSSESSGTPFYLVFDTAAIEADKTYYVYLIRHPHDSYSGGGYTHARRDAISAELTYTSYTACGSPTIFNVTPELFDDHVNLSWSGAKGGTNNGITGYNIQCAVSTNGGSSFGEWKSIWQNNQNAVTFSESFFAGEGVTINRGDYVKFRIRTLGAAGSAYYSGWKESDVVRRNQLPSAPTSGQINSEYSPGDIVTVSWEGAADPDGNISVCRIYCAVTESADKPEEFSVLTEIASGESGIYRFSPDQAGYQQYLHIAVQMVDSFGMSGPIYYIGASRRNDDPLVDIFDGTNICKHLVTICEVSAEKTTEGDFGKYMPYIFNGESWDRCCDLEQ